MRFSGWSIALAMALAGCGGASEEAVPREREAASAPAPSAPVSGPERHILAFGDSLFAGYGLGEGESYPARLEAALRRQGLNVRVTNAGVSGDTTAAARQRLDFVLGSMETPPDLAIVEFGGNDLLRSLPPAETRANLDAILAELRGQGIRVLLMGMRAPPNLGEDFVAQFDAIYRDLAERHDAELVPFFLEPVYGHAALMQQDRIHPTAEGIETLVAATADEVVGALPAED